MDENKQTQISEFARLYLTKKGVNEQDAVDEDGNLKQEYIEVLQKKLETLDENFWVNFEQNPEETMDTLINSETEQMDKTQFAAKGAKLKMLKGQKGVAFEKGKTKEYSRTEFIKKGGKKKKCECGCEVKAKFEKGGTISHVCSCCGEVHNTSSLKCGGKLKKKQEGGSIESASSKVGVAKKGTKVTDRIKTAQSGMKTKPVTTPKSATKSTVKPKPQPKINGKTQPDDYSDYAIPTKEEGGVDMNPKTWKKGQSNAAKLTVNKKENGGKVTDRLKKAKLLKKK